MQELINICQNDRILGNVALSHYLPSELPVGSARFDLIYAYSVFTHTSERATLAALKTLRRYVKPNGMLVITVRPVEIFDNPSFGENEKADREALVSQFEKTGFSFLPNPHFQTDGDYTYGVTAMSTDWLAEKAPYWKLCRVDRGEDHLQRILVMTPN